MKNRQKNNDSFFARHFKKQRVNCPKCHNSIDAYLDKCPYCANTRSIDILPKKFLNMTLLTDYKELCFFLVGSIGIVLIALIIGFGITNFPMNQYLKSGLINLLSYIATLAIFFCISSHDSLKICLSFKNQSKKLKTWIFVFAGLAIIIGFSFAYQYALKAGGISIVDTENQSEINKLILNCPAIAFFFVVLLGPIVEEFTYRVGLYSLLRKRNRWLAYILTVLIFAFVHFIPSLITAPQQMANEALNIPLYIIPSLVLAISYEYTGVTSSLSIHILNNLLSFILIFAL